MYIPFYIIFPFSGKYTSSGTEDRKTTADDSIKKNAQDSDFTNRTGHTGAAGIIIKYHDFKA